jgi:hypothetical protein
MFFSAFLKEYSGNSWLFAKSSSKKSFFLESFLAVKAKTLYFNAFVHFGRL